MIRLNDKFKPLFETDKRYIILTGGRGSAKSFATGIFTTLLLHEAGHRVLFTRYTMVSAKLSIIPEFKQKIELLEQDSDFIVNEREIIHKKSKSEVLFRGIKTSEGIQTAHLKSIQGVTTWIVDEAEEIPDEETFDKIDLSIRQKGVQNRVILILNPTTREHWIWKKFFAETHTMSKVEGYDVPMSTHPDVCHIHTTYLDNIENLDEGFLKVIESIKENNKQRYGYEIIGGWKIQLEGRVFNVEELKRFSWKDFKPEEGRQAILGYIDVADEGIDAFAFPIGYVYKNKLFIVDVLFSTKSLTYTQPAAVAMINKHNIVKESNAWVRVETNNQGSVVIKNLRELTAPHKILPVTHSSNKHTRIIMSELFVKQYVYFLEDKEIIHNSDYDLFFRQILDYPKDKKEENLKDDAPDALSGLTQFAQNHLSNLFRNG